jgi:HlyD family secretion protein
MDVEIAPEVRRRRVVRRVVAVVIAIAAVAFLLTWTVEWLRPSVRRDAIQIARVERGAVEATVQANGTVVPLDEQVVSSPVEARVLRVGRRAGDRVRAGDELLTLDTEASRLDAARLGDRVTQLENTSAELRLRLEDSIANLEAQIEQKKLDVQILHYTSEQRTKLRADGLIAEQDALAAAAAAKKSDIELRQLEEARTRALRSRDMQLAASQADISTSRRDRDEAKRQLELAMLRADRDGVLTSIVNEVGATIRRGDVLARIADLSAYRVEASISDIHAARLAAGMRARVKLEGAVIGGVIESVDPRIVDGVVRFTVTLDQPSHALLRNNLRVDVAVVTGRRTNVLTVRRGALARTNTDHAFVVRGDAVHDRAVRVPIRFGLGSDETIEILDGLQEGDAVVISNMSDFDEVKEVRLK